MKFSMKRISDVQIENKTTQSCFIIVFKIPLQASCVGHPLLLHVIQETKGRPPNHLKIWVMYGPSNCYLKFSWFRRLIRVRVDHNVQKIFMKNIYKYIYKLSIKEVLT